MSKNQLHALSPLDGRYENSVKELSVYFSESALIKYRLKIEIEYLIALSKEKGIKELPTLKKQEQSRLRKIYLNFNSSVGKYIFFNPSCHISEYDKLLISSDVNAK